MITTIAVLGAGQMGNGIAHVFAQYGYEVILYDIAAAQLEKALATIRQNLERMVNIALHIKHGHTAGSGDFT